MSLSDQQVENDVQAAANDVEIDAGIEEVANIKVEPLESNQATVKIEPLVKQETD